MVRRLFLSLALTAVLTLLPGGRAFGQMGTIDISAPELGYAIGEDEAAAAARYLGKQLRITGVAERIMMFEGRPVLVMYANFSLKLLEGGGTPPALSIPREQLLEKYPDFKGFVYQRIYCFLDRGQTDLLAEAVWSVYQLTPCTVTCDLLERVEANKRPGVCLMY